MHGLVSLSGVSAAGYIQVYGVSVGFAYTYF